MTQVSVEVTASAPTATVIEVGEPITVTRVEVENPVPQVEVIDAYITGPAGPAGPAGPPGNTDPDIPDLSLLFENGLI